jgi:hypothetical protein
MKNIINTVKVMCLAILGFSGTCVYGVESDHYMPHLYIEYSPMLISCGEHDSTFIQNEFSRLWQNCCDFLNYCFINCCSTTTVDTQSEILVPTSNEIYTSPIGADNGQNDNAFHDDAFDQLIIKSFLETSIYKDKGITKEEVIQMVWCTKQAAKYTPLSQDELNERIALIQKHFPNRSREDIMQSYGKGFENRMSLVALETGSR